MCLYVPCCDIRYDFRIKRCWVRLYLQLFVWGLISYLRYLCLFPYIGAQHILCCVFVSFFFVLCTTCCHFLWIVLFYWPFGIFQHLYRHVLWKARFLSINIRRPSSSKIIFLVSLLPALHLILIWFQTLWVKISDHCTHKLF